MSLRDDVVKILKDNGLDSFVGDMTQVEHTEIRYHEVSEVTDEEMNKIADEIIEKIHYVNKCECETHGKTE